jgi:archaemetzincin
MKNNLIQIIGIFCCTLFIGCQEFIPSSVQQFTTLASLDVEKINHGNDDWLAAHSERYQSMQMYIASNPNHVNAQQKYLYITTIGFMDSLAQQTLQLTCDYLSIVYQMPLKILPSINSSSINANNQRVLNGKIQFKTKYILDTILKPILPTDAFACIGFTTTDLYPQDDWHFVFGQASLKNRVGVWSMARLRNTESKNIFVKRTLQVAVHEVGHLFGITHCTNYECTMNGSNSLEESDGQNMWMCHKCISKLAWNRQLCAVKYLEKLDAFWQRNKDIDSNATNYYSVANALVKFATNARK